MRTLFGILLLAWCGGSLPAEDAWERVFPADYPLKEDLVPLSIGIRMDRESMCEYLIGCRDGYVVYAQAESPLDPLDWQVLQLPVGFDITSIANANGKWILGGESSYIAQYLGPSPGLSTRAEDWQSSRVSIRPIEDIKVLSESVLVARTDYDTPVSIDGGESWEDIETNFYQGGDIELFKGKLYGTRTRYLNSSIHLQLLVSQNGLDWETALLIDMGTSRLVGATLRVLTEAVDEEGYPLPSSERLYLNAYYSTNPVEGDPSTTEEIHLSTTDGLHWLDTGSVKQVLVENGDGSIRTEQVFWNPLSLPDDQMGFTYPEMIDNFSGDLDTNLLVTGQGLFQYSGTEISNVYRVRNLTGSILQRGTISQWNKLVWIMNSDSSDSQGSYELVTLSKEGVIETFPMPGADFAITAWQQLIATGDGTFALATTADGSQKLFRTTDIETWISTPLPPDSRQVVLKRKGNQLAAFYKDGDYSGPNRIAVWNDSWTVELQLPMRYTDSTYMKKTGRWYSVYPAPYSVLLIEIISEDNHKEIDRFYQKITTSDARDFYKISCPDDEHFLVYGGTPDVGVFNSSGFVTAREPPWKGGWGTPERIDGAQHVNGWYYIPAYTTSRTQDFVTWETLDIPDNDEVFHVTGFGDNVYIFTENAVYKKPLQKGYLDSFEHEHGWRYSEWLGWFTIVEEAEGIINHLRLGQCQVTQENENEYWLDTSALGSILIEKDRIPWLWQQSTEKWYRLDRDAWPPRMWDPGEETWIGINP